MSKKSLLITGCSSGIGYDAAHAMRARGWRVFASCRKAEDCDRLIAEGFESKFTQADGKWVLEINSGTVQMSNNKVIVLAD